MHARTRVHAFSSVPRSRTHSRWRDGGPIVPEGSELDDDRRIDGSAVLLSEARHACMVGLLYDGDRVGCHPVIRSFPLPALALDISDGKIREAVGCSTWVGIVFAFIDYGVCS